MFEWFAFHPSRIVTQPWGAATYMFLHGGLWHLLMNMLVLFFFGPPLEDRWGSREFLRYYIVCGLGGVALSFLFASGSSVVGASAAIYGLMLAFAMTWPDSPIYVWGIFPVKAKWLMTFLFALTLLSATGGGGGGGGVAHFAHLGGILAGFLYLRSDGRIARLSLSLPSRKDGASGGGSTGGRVTRVSSLTREPRPQESRKETVPGRGRARPWRDAEEEALLDEVDRVLDKISATGMASLSPDERRLLDEVSKRHRAN
jgi:membrane associated rhomboid family serine protease